MRTAKIYKDDFFPSHPWNCDLTDENGELWFKWQAQYRTRKGLIEAIKGFDASIVLTGRV
jgi:hypothetical protein